MHALETWKWEEFVNYFNMDGDEGPQFDIKTYL